MRVSPVADELGRRFAAAGHELHLVGGSVRDALLGRLGDDLDFCTDARPEQTLALVQGWAEAIWTTGRGVRHDRRCPARPAPGGHHVPRRGVRPGEPQPDRARTATSLRRRPAPARLRRQRDGGRRCPGTCSPTRTAGSADLAAQGAAHAGHAARSRSPTTRCGCCAPPGSPRSCGSRSRRRCVAAMATWPATWPGSPPSGSATSSSS